MFFKSKKPEAPSAAEAPAFVPPPNLRDAFQSVKEPRPAPMAASSAPLMAAPQPESVAQAATARAPAPSPRATADSREPARAFAQIATLLARSEAGRQLALADLEWLVTAPLKANQVVVAEGRAKSGVQGAIGAVLWARVSPAVDQRLMSDKAAVPRLAPEEWTSGDIAWVIVTAGETNIVNAMLDQLLRGPLAGRSIRTRAVGPGGILTIQELRAQAAA